ncbi:MAG TPA: methyltransferase [Terracidiphilus sp.]|nr:methyltransferase [Terracidiphilus sp.]
MKLNIITLAIAVVGLLFFAVHASGLPWTPAHIVGAAIALPSFLLVVVARMQLGGAFSVTAKASTLVTTGLYSRIRNPIYVFSALMILGIIIWSGRPLLLLAFAVLVPMQIYRSHNEAQVLTEKFGAAYLKYKKTTWF